VLGDVQPTQATEVHQLSPNQLGSYGMQAEVALRAQIDHRWTVLGDST
jgi:hypothetical protein